eukprot:SAG11_NODE_885_length_6732_cov_3.853309_3_plen_58_part_00
MNKGGDELLAGAQISAEESHMEEFGSGQGGDRSCGGASDGGLVVAKWRIVVAIYMII